MSAALIAKRAQQRVGRVPPRRNIGIYNRLFHRACVRALAREKLLLETFDLWHCKRLNEPRLLGQIVFEYGTLLNWDPVWNGLQVLDIGTGASTFPQWMAAQKAEVTTLDLPEPAESISSRLRLSHALGARRQKRGTTCPRHRVGSMFDLDFPNDSFDLVTSFSVIEHVDTSFPDRTYVPYREQKRLAAKSIDEMIRVTKPGGHIYLTSDCCDYRRATSDAWRHYYYYREGPELSGAWPVEDVQPLFYDYVLSKGCSLVGPLAFAAEAVNGDPAVETFRGKYWSAFSVLARKE